MVEVRKATLKDIDAIIPMWHRLMSMPEHIKGFMQVADDGAVHYKATLEKWMEKEGYFVYVAEEDGCLLGYMAGWLVTQSPVFKYREKIYINDLWVELIGRRRGVGKQLMDMAEKLAKEKNIEFIDLSVAYANENSLEFYKANGFKPAYYRMVKTINNKL
jgi:ribosomal protein S18 acetylase RimI-like enzyme